MQPPKMIEKGSHGVLHASPVAYKPGDDEQVLESSTLPSAQDFKKSKWVLLFLEFSGLGCFGLDCFYMDAIADGKVKLVLTVWCSLWYLLSDSKPLVWKLHRRWTRLAHHFQETLACGHTESTLLLLFTGGLFVFFDLILLWVLCSWLRFVLFDLFAAISFAIFTDVGGVTFNTLPDNNSFVWYLLAIWVSVRIVHIRFEWMCAALNDRPVTFKVSNGLTGERVCTVRHAKFRETWVGGWAEWFWNIWMHELTFDLTDAVDNNESTPLNLALVGQQVWREEKDAMPVLMHPRMAQRVQRFLRRYSRKYHHVVERAYMHSVPEVTFLVDSRVGKKLRGALGTNVVLLIASFLEPPGTRNINAKQLKNGSFICIEGDGDLRDRVISHLDAYQR